MPAAPPRLALRAVRLRLTLAGWLFLAVAVLVGVAAGKSEAPLMYVLFGAMMGALMVSASMAHRAVGAVRVRRQMPSRTWQNQTVHLRYALRNLRRRRACLGLRVEEVAPTGIESVAGYCLHLAGGATFRAGARFAAERRGRVRLQRIRISTTFPFGLLRAWRTLEWPEELVVWPGRGLLLRQLLCHGAVESSRAAPSLASGGQDEFFGLREYRSGDNPRWIHWRKSAARTVPVLREMARPLPEVLWVIVDTLWEDLSPLGEEQRERTLRFAATVIDYAMGRGYKVGLALAYDAGVQVHPPAAGLGHHRKLLDALADVDVNTRWTLLDTLGSLGRPEIRPAQVILATGQPSGPEAQCVSALRAACRHLYIVDGSVLGAVFTDDVSFRAEAACR